jgi:hypothetical protein
LVSNSQSMPDMETSLQIMLSGLWSLLNNPLDMEAGFRLRYPVSGLLVSPPVKRKQSRGSGSVR